MRDANESMVGVVSIRVYRVEGEDLMEDGLCGNCGSQVEGLGLLACGWKLDAGSWKTQARIMRTICGWTNRL